MWNSFKWKLILLFCTSKKRWNMKIVYFKWIFEVLCDWQHPNQYARIGFRLIAKNKSDWIESEKKSRVGQRKCERLFPKINHTQKNPPLSRSNANELIHILWIAVDSTKKATKEKRIKTASLFQFRFDQFERPIWSQK